MKLEDAIAFVGGNYGPSNGQLVNIVFRCMLNFASGVACWVPMRLFYKNGELAGTTMVIAIAILNFYYFINTLIWPNDDIASWPKGYGWCDIQLASWVPVETLNAAAVCAILHNVSSQVSLMRASGLSGNEKRRKHLIQALIIFPIPVLQLVLYYFVIAIRYNISGIIGCQAVFDGDWVFLVFYLLPCPVFAAIAAYFAALTWWRYRQIDATSQQALWNSGNSSVQARNARTRQKLYFMTLTIIAPYFPLQMAFMYSNIHQGMPWSKPYNLSQLHFPGWTTTIDYSPSTIVPFTSMYINYVAVIEVIIFYLYFGRSKDAHDMYRKYLRDEQNGIGAHTDVECFTIVTQDSAGGLEVLSKSGNWVKAEPIPGAFVVNIADCFMRQTNDFFVSTVHRVINKSGKERYSAPFFFGFNRQKLLEPVPTCVSEVNPMKYPVMTGGEYYKFRARMVKGPGASSDEKQNTEEDM